MIARMPDITGLRTFIWAKTAILCVFHLASPLNAAEQAFVLSIGRRVAIMDLWASTA